MNIYKILIDSKKGVIENDTPFGKIGKMALINSKLLVLISILLFSACKKNETSSSGTSSSESQKSTFNMRMTDAPGDYDAVYVEIIGAEVNSDVNGWVALNVKAGIYNLLDLTNGKDTLIANGQVAVGNVSQIRLILGDNNKVVVKGTTYLLTTPSAQQSGLKLQVHAELLAGVDYNMLLDFDADKSIVATGNGKYMLKPVIRVVTKATTGSIQGLVLPLLAHPAVYAISGTDSFSTYTDTLTGTFYIGGLSAGSYKVLVMPKAPYTDTAILGVGVTIGAITNVGLITVK
ncbi:MAG: DUF4382 domain-containing protein [bacterium]|nr:DUF4382 domain-containing protein [bacterium]